MPPPRFRLLIVEDSPERLALFRSWVPGNVHIVSARSAGAAIGLIRRDPGSVYGGVLLDHDLQQQVITEDDRDLSGSDVARELIKNFSFDIPILVHSTNLAMGRRVVNQLGHAGFWVTHIPMYQLTEDLFLDWILEVMDLWEKEND